MREAHTVTPYMVIVRSLMSSSERSVHAEVAHGPGSEGGCIARCRRRLHADGGRGWRGICRRRIPRPCAFGTHVPDCDATYERALAAGGVSLGKPAPVGALGECDSRTRHLQGKTRVGPGTDHPAFFASAAGRAGDHESTAFGATELGRHPTPDGVIRHAR